MWRGACERHQPGVSHQGKVAAAHPAPPDVPSGGEASFGGDGGEAGSSVEFEDADGSATATAATGASGSIAADATGGTAAPAGAGSGSGIQRAPPRTHTKAQIRGGSRRSSPNRGGRRKGDLKRGRSPSSSSVPGEDEPSQSPVGGAEFCEPPEGVGAPLGGARPFAGPEETSSAVPATSKAPVKPKKPAKAVSSANRERLLKKPRAHRTKVPDKYHVVGRQCASSLVITTYIAVGYDGVHRLLQRIEISRFGSHDHGETPVGSPEDQLALKMWPYPTVAHYLQEVSSRTRFLLCFVRMSPSCGQSICNVYGFACPGVCPRSSRREASFGCSSPC